MEQNDKVEISCVAHSFGSTVAIDFLADLQINQKVKIRLITLGAALNFIIGKSSWLEEEVKKCQQNDDALLSWRDYYSEKDWLCSKTTNYNAKIDYQSIPINDNISIIDRANGTSHGMYFYNKEVLNEILE